LLVFILTLFFIGLLLYLLKLSQDYTSQLRKASQSYPFLTYARLLDGKRIVNKEKVNLRPVAVVLDNAFDARPIVGLTEASLVYETIAEGAITRFLAIYDQDALPSVIGPVRSLRPYFLDWAREVDSIVVHVGGSPQALEALDVVDNLNEFSEGKYFYRESSRIAPHHIFTSQKFLREGLEDMDYPTTTFFQTWSYSDSLPQTTSTSVSQVTINFSTEPYKVSWLYDEKENDYKRFINQLPEEISAKNIIIQVVQSRVIDDLLRRSLTLIGEGRAWILNNGQLFIGTWEKPGSDVRTRYFDQDGAELRFLPGSTWIEVIEDEGQVRF